VEVVVVVVMVVVVVVVVREFGKSKSRMSDLKKCRLGNLSNKGKLLWERVLDEDPVQRPEDPVDYIQDPSFQKTAPVSRRVANPCTLERLQGTSGAASHPKSVGVKTVPRVAKSSLLQVRSLCPLGQTNREWTRRSEIPCWCQSDSTQRIRERGEER
jgi:hypothetical protein